jgi:hypothetical protein
LEDEGRSGWLNSMMSFVANPLMRVVLAMYLAVWTPAMCCCAIKSAMGHAPCAIAVQDDAPSCCAAKQKATCCATPTESTAPSESKCRCHEKPVDRLATGTKTIVKAPDFQVGTLQWAPANDAIAAPHFEDAPIAIQLRRAHPPPLHDTLIALRTLLLI